MGKGNKIIDIIGDFVVIDISTPRYPNSTSIMDASDFYAIPERIRMTIIGYPQIKRNKKCVLVHRLLNPSWEIIDHINRDRTDNRRSNLREATQSQNSMNRAMCILNKSGVTGVCWHKCTMKWRASIKINKKCIHLGVFKSIEMAKKARKEAEIVYFGEFSFNPNIKPLDFANISMHGLKELC